MHQSQSDLQRGVIDFNPYLQELISSFDNESVSKQYIEQKTVDGEDLESTVTEWLHSDNCDPLAILGGYGMGKTTFARRISSKLASLAISDTSARIPILIPLGLISSEQSLSGLLGSLFTEIHCLQRYSFHAFSLLNNLGKLVIILDGFDEMKHTLNWSEFRYNFQQLLKLALPRSKIILLGRPTAFINDYEHIYILQGKYERGGIEYSIPDWPCFIEKQLAMFDKEQISCFVKKFNQQKIQCEPDHKKQQYLINKAEAVYRGLSENNIKDIAKRPVQLKMLMEILPEWDGDITKLTVTLLYDHFIDLMIERESEKVVRKRFNDKERRLFAKEIAWWIWCGKSNDLADEQSIPNSIVEKFTRENEDLEAIKRDLVSSSILERKLGGLLYFPHRSLQEFLVAEKLHSMISDENNNLIDAQIYIAGEVGDFLIEMSNDDELLKWVDSITNYRGLLARNVASIFIAKESCRESILSLADDKIDIKISHRKRNPWYVLLSLLYVQRYQVCDTDIKILIDQCQKNIRSYGDVMFSQLNAFCAIMMCAKYKTKYEDMMYETLMLIRSELCAPLISKSKSIIDEISAIEEEIGQSFDDSDPYQYLADNEENASNEMNHIFIAEIGSLKSELTSINKIILAYSKSSIDKGHKVNLEEYFNTAIQGLSTYCMLNEWVEDNKITFIESSLSTYFDLNRHQQANLKKENEELATNFINKFEKPKIVKRNRKRF